MILNNDEHKKGWTDIRSKISFKDRLWIKLQKLNPLNRYWVHEVVIGLRNLIKYAGVVYRDRDYDYEYLYTLLKFKLSNIRNYLDHHQTFVGVEDEIGRLDQVIAALDRVIKDQYEDEAVDRLYEKYGHPKAMKRPADNGGSYIDFVHEHIKTEQQEREYNRQFKAAIKKGAAARQKDLNFVCDTIKRYSMNWWE